MSLDRDSQKFLDRFGPSKKALDVDFILADGTTVYVKGVDGFDGGQFEHESAVEETVGKSLTDFLRSTGTIRVSFFHSGVGFDIGGKPTESQIDSACRFFAKYSKLIESLDGGLLSISISKAGHWSKFVEINPATAGRLRQVLEAVK